MSEGVVIVGFGGLHVAEGRSTSAHALHALKVLVPLEGTLTYVGARTLRTRAPLVVPADHRHAAACDGVSLCVFVEPEARDGRLRAWTRADAPTELRGATADAIRGIAEEIARALGRVPHADHARMIDAMSSRLLAETAAPQLDARVKRAIARVSLDARISLDALAADVSLSRFHLAHRVKAELGVTLSHLALFRRLMNAHRRVLAGEPLARAAIAAGFADQAHFSRTTRQMLGQSPSFVAATAFKTPRPEACTMASWKAS